jgi:quercetin dioxygenase-like cupin family protein
MHPSHIPFNRLRIAQRKRVHYRALRMSYQFGPAQFLALTVGAVGISFTTVNVNKVFGGALMWNFFWMRLTRAILVGLCLCAGLLAQDPTKVEPTHYKLAFENEYVQVVNVHYGPHEKSGLHAHMGGVVVVLTAGHLRFTDENGKTQEVFAKPGDPRWFPPFKHRVENLGDTSYNAVYIGIKNKRLAGEASVRSGPQMDAQTKQLVTEALLASMK